MTGSRIVDLADFLVGDWELDRRIAAAGGQRTGRFTGWARFEADPEVAGLLRYLERGTLRLDAYDGPAYRRLGYHVEGPRARVVFEDGRFFHDLDLRDGVCEVEHPCGADLYRGRFEVVDDDRWHQEWTVVGPDKDQVIRTVLHAGPDRRGGTAPGTPPAAGP